MKGYNVETSLNASTQIQTRNYLPTDLRAATSNLTAFGSTGSKFATIDPNRLSKETRCYSPKTRMSIDEFKI